MSLEASTRRVNQQLTYCRNLMDHLTETSGQWSPALAQALVLQMELTLSWYCSELAQRCHQGYRVAGPVSRDDFERIGESSEVRELTVLSRESGSWLDELLTLSEGLRAQAVSSNGLKGALFAIDESPANEIPAIESPAAADRSIERGNLIDSVQIHEESGASSSTSADSARIQTNPAKLNALLTSFSSMVARHRATNEEY